MAPYPHREAHHRVTNPRPSLEARIAQRITSDGSVVVPPRMARWLEKQSGMTADRRIRLRDNDPDAYVVLAALHLAALRSDIGTNDDELQQVRGQLDIWMSSKEAAKALNVTDRCIRNWCRTGRLRGVMSGSRWLVDPNTLNLKNIA
jgi:excisionase family DNA binding protein